MTKPVRIKGYVEIIEALDEARTVAGHLSDFCVETLEENETLRSKLATVEKERDNALKAHSSGRYTVEDTLTGVRICRGEHAKGAPCEWIRYSLERGGESPDDEVRELIEGIRARKHNEKGIP